MRTFVFLSEADDWLDDFFRKESPDGEETLELLALFASAAEETEASCLVRAVDLENSSLFKEKEKDEEDGARLLLFLV